MDIRTPVCLRPRWESRWRPLWKPPYAWAN